MNLVRVWTDIGSRKPSPLVARVLKTIDTTYTIVYLSECDDKIWRYETDEYEIDNDSLAEDLKTTDEEDIGFIPYLDGFTKGDHDFDYNPDEESDDDSCSSTEDNDDSDEEEAQATEYEDDGDDAASNYSD